MEHLHLCGLVFMVLGAKSDDKVVVVGMDEDAALPCAAPEPVQAESCHRVRWVKYVNGNQQDILSKPERIKNPDAARAEWKPDGNGSFSLFLTRVIKSDEGLYGCEIWRGWDRIHVQNTYLKVKDCKSMLVRWEAWATPPTNLTCPADTTNLVKPTDFSWMMLKAGKVLPITPGMAEINGSLLSFRSTNGTDDSWYRCNYTLGEVQRCYDIRLKVQADLPPTTETTSRKEKEGKSEQVEVPQSFRTVHIAVTVVLLVAMAAAAAGFFVYRRWYKRPTAAPWAERRAEGHDVESYANCRSRESMVFNHNSIYHVIADAASR